MNKINSTTIVSRDPSMIAADVEDSIVMLNVELGRYFELNSVASAIWNLLDQPRSVSDLHAALLEQFDVEPQQCEREMLEFLKIMIDRGLFITDNSGA
jgi:Coenzyme PQQ synthesis protein D (PqqD)